MEGFNDFGEDPSNHDQNSDLDYERELELAFAGFPTDPDTIPDDYSMAPMAPMAPIAPAVPTQNNQPIAFPENPYYVQTDPWQDQAYPRAVASPPLPWPENFSQDAASFQIGDNSAGFDMPGYATTQDDSQVPDNGVSRTSSPLFVHSDNSSSGPHEATQNNSTLGSPANEDHLAEPYTGPAHSYFSSRSSQYASTYSLPNPGLPDEQQVQMNRQSPTSPSTRHHVPYHPYARPSAVQGDAHVSTRKHPECSKINLLIYELRTRELLDWEEIACILNARSHDRGKRKAFSVAAVYGRFSRNFDRIAPQYNDEELNKDDFVYLKRRRGGSSGFRTRLMHHRRAMQQERDLASEQRNSGVTSLQHHPEQGSSGVAPFQRRSEQQSQTNHTRGGFEGNENSAGNDAEVDKVLKEVYEQVAPPFWSLVAQVVNMRCGTERGAEECAKRHGEL